MIKQNCPSHPAYAIEVYFISNEYNPFIGVRANFYSSKTNNALKVSFALFAPILKYPGPMVY
jgi:hypothetical protein